MRHTLRIILLVSLLVLGVADHRAAHPRLEGNLPEHWNEDGYSVVIAVVQEISKPSANREFRATLLPTATLAGVFDASRNPQLSVIMSAETVNTSIRIAPKAGDTVVAVICHTERGWVVTMKSCAFTPDGSGLVIVDNLGDPKVAEIVVLFRAVRHPGNPATNPVKKPTTQPANRG